MGLLDQLAGAVKGAILEGDLAPAILAGVLEKTSVGGLSGMLGRLQAAGLGDQMASWTSGGQRQAITIDQLKAALTPELIQEIADKLTLPPDGALAYVANHLPMLAASPP